MTKPDICFINQDRLDPGELTFKGTAFTIAVSNKTVLTITKDGELLFDNATEAAEALLKEWNRIRSKQEPSEELIEWVAELEAAHEPSVTNKIILGLVMAAGKLVIATDEQEALRAERQAVLDALTAIKAMKS